MSKRIDNAAEAKMIRDLRTPCCAARPIFVLRPVGIGSMQIEEVREILCSGPGCRSSWDANSKADEKYWDGPEGKISDDRLAEVKQGHADRYIVEIDPEARQFHEDSFRLITELEEYREPKELNITNYATARRIIESLREEVTQLQKRLLRREGSEKVEYGIYIAGDAQGGSRDSIEKVSEETARNHENDSWSWAVRITTERL